MIADALQYRSKRSYPYVVLTVLDKPKPEDIDRKFKLNKSFIRLPVFTLKVAIWGFEDEQDGFKSAKSHGLHVAPSTIDWAIWS